MVFYLLHNSFCISNLPFMMILFQKEYDFSFAMTCLTFSNKQENTCATCEENIGIQVNHHYCEACGKVSHMMLMSNCGYALFTKFHSVYVKHAIKIMKSSYTISSVMVGCVEIVMAYTGSKMNVSII